MALTVRYFARFREQLGCDSEPLPCLPGDTPSILMARLAARGGRWQDIFAGDTPVLVAINDTMAQADAELQDGDNVAFFPPVTGG